MRQAIMAMLIGTGERRARKVSAFCAATAAPAATSEKSAIVKITVAGSRPFCADVGMPYLEGHGIRVQEFGI